MSKTELRIRFLPWFWFTWFAIANSLLSYASLTLTLKPWIFLLGLVVPLFLLFSTQPPLSPSAYKNPSFLLEDFLGTRLTQPWVWFTLVIFAAVLRFWDIGSLSRWPGGDSSLMALSVIQWMDHLQWKPFVTLSQVPSTIVYLFYFTAKLTGSFLYGIQLPSSLISFLTLFLAYATARLYFPRSLASILGTLVAFNEWDLMLSRSDEAGVLLPFWEWGVLYLLGRLIFAQSRSSRIAWASGLGLALGMGPYTFMAWPILGVLVFGVALVWFWKKMEVPAGGFFLLGFMVALIPFLKAAWQEGYGGHLHDVAVWTNPSFSWLQQVQVAVGYIQSVFWGGTTGIEMAPDGGFLNVFLGSLFFLGFFEIFRFRRLFLSRFLLVALFLFLLPGLLTRDLEAHRILLILPILLVFVSVGIRSLLLSFPERFRLILLVGILGTSVMLDLIRLFHPGENFFHPASETADTNEYRADYRILKSLAQEKGPGWIFTDMLPNTFDYSLAYCSYPFNAAWNPRIGGDVKWAAVFTERHCLPFLSKTFPSCDWIIQPTPKAGVLSRHALGLIAVTPENQPVLARWKSYYSFQQEINLETVDMPTGISHQAILEKMLRAYPSIPEDSFLQSCYFEKLVFNYSSEKVFHPEDTWANWSNFSGILQKSFAKSYQDVELCEKYGRLLAVEGQRAEAKMIFQQALKLMPGNPWLKSEMQQLGLAS